MRVPTPPVDGALSRSKLGQDSGAQGEARPLCRWCVRTRMREWPARYRRGIAEGTARAATSYRRVNPFAAVYPRAPR